MTSFTAQSDSHEKAFADCHGTSQLEHMLNMARNIGRDMGHAVSAPLVNLEQSAIEAGHKVATMISPKVLNTCRT